MSRPALRAFVSFGSVSIALVIAAVSLPFLGCTGDDFSQGTGTCDDDKNPCTIDSCPAGVTVHENAAKGTACAVGGNAGTCDGEGTCVRNCESNPSACKCENDTQCPMSTECLAWSCSGGVCTGSPRNGGMPVTEQVAGDCKVIRCAQDGSTQTQNDDTDVPMSEMCLSRKCVNGTVVEKRCNGATCTLAEECESGFCADGVCCVSNCTEECKSCAVPGKVGTCELVPVYGDDPKFTSDVTGLEDNCLGMNDFTCNGAGQCLKLGGAGCKAPAECVSGLCKSLMAGMFCRGVVGEPCDANSDCDLNMCVGGFCK